MESTIHLRNDCARNAQRAVSAAADTVPLASPVAVAMKCLRHQERSTGCGGRLLFRAWLSIPVVCVLAGVCGVAETAGADFFRAVKTGDHAEVERLAESGTNINAVDSQGMTALIWAANQGNGELVRLLLSKGADANAADVFGWTALIHAAGAGHSGTVQALLDGGAAVSAFSNNGTTALIAAAGNYETVKILLAHGADPLASANDGTTALLAAKNLGNEAVVQLLEPAVPPNLHGRQASATQQPSPATGVTLPDPATFHTPIPGNSPATVGNISNLPPDNTTGVPEQTADPGAVIQARRGSDSPVSPSLPDRQSAEQVSPRETKQTSSSDSSLSPAIAVPAEYTVDRLYLQAGAFRSVASAEQLSQQLGARGHPSILRKRLETYLSLVGPFPDEYSAIAYRAKLTQEGFEAFIARLPDTNSIARDAYAAPATDNSAGESSDLQRAEHPRGANELAERSALASNPQQRPEPHQSTPSQIFLQLGAFRAEGNALSFAESLGLDREPVVQSAADGWYRVVLGPFPTREAATAYSERLMTQGRKSVLRVP